MISDMPWLGSGSLVTALATGRPERIARAARSTRYCGTTRPAKLDVDVARSLISPSTCASLRLRSRRSRARELPSLAEYASMKNDASPRADFSGE
jgi:hypothetical protein